MYASTEILFERLLFSLDNNKGIFLRKAYNFSKSAHEGQKRKSWEDYFVHPLQVSLDLRNKFQDIDLTIAWLLHDTVEDNPAIQMQDIHKEFWDDIGFLVDSVTKTKESYYLSDRVFEKKIDKLIHWWMKDVRCFLLKIADRNDNLQTISNLKDNKQVRMAFETQAIFNPMEEMLDYDRIQNVIEAQENFNEICGNSDIKNEIELKAFLIHITFDNFSNESFDAVYKSTHNVTWKITNKSMLDHFLKIANIDEKIDVVSIEHWDDNHFCFEFKFKKWEVIDTNIKLSIWNTYSF